mgnify:CR=1 FL=1
MKSRKDAWRPHERIFSELLEALGPVPDQLRDQLEELEELGDLRALLKLAAKADSLDVFEKGAEKYLQSSQSGKQ